MKEFGQNMADWGKQFGEQDGQKFDPCVMKKKVGWFMRQMFAGKNPSTEGGCQMPFRCGKKFGADGRKNPQRATVVSVPEAVLCGCPGDIVYAVVTLNNGGNHPYREGFHVQSCYSTEEMKGQFEDIKVPLGQVAANSNFSVKVPIKIK